MHVKVELGEIETEGNVSDDQKKKLDNTIKKAGMELLEKKQGVLIEKIRKVMVDYVSNSDYEPGIKFSDLLSKELNHSYTYLSNLFSEVEATSFNKMASFFRILQAGFYDRFFYQTTATGFQL